MNKILEYQDLDIELSKLEKYINTMPDKLTMNKMSTFVKDAQHRTLKLEGSASELYEEYKLLNEKLANLQLKIKTLNDLKKAKSITKEDYQKAYQTINTLSSEVFMLDRNFNKLIENARYTLDDFKSTKTNVMRARTKHQESKDKYEEELNKYLPKINDIKLKMKDLEKSIPKDLIEKYRTMKNDNIFPVFVKLVDKKCSACMMGIPSSKLDKLKDINYIVCEQCRRLIFVQEDN